MSSLSRIQVKGFKSIREMDLELRALNVLIGANGAGKSNFVQVFYLLNQIMESRLQSYVAKLGGADNLLYFGQKATNELRIRLHFDPNGYDVALTPTIGDSFYFSTEQFWYHKDPYPQPYVVELGSGHTETQLYEESAQHLTKKAVDYVVESIKSWKLYQFHDTSDSAKVKKTGDIGDNEYLHSDASNLAAFLYLMRETQPEHYNRIVKTIHLIAPFFDDFNLRPSPFNPETIRLEWREKTSDKLFNAGALSDGTLRFMCLATLLLQPVLPETVLIDEPELGLHPFAISVLASLLRSAAGKTQVIVSTQSVPLVNQFAPEDVIVVDRIDGQSVFKRLSTEDITNWLDEYGLGDLWEKNVIGGRP